VDRKVLPIIVVAMQNCDATDTELLVAIAQIGIISVNNIDIACTVMRRPLLRV